jgi:hypothetical protein
MRRYIPVALLLYEGLKDRQNNNVLQLPVAHAADSELRAHIAVKCFAG